MARKRSAKYDWICRRCGCPCNPPDADCQVHVGGGQNRRACRWAPLPVLRSEFEAEAAAAVAAMRLFLWGA